MEYKIKLTREMKKLQDDGVEEEVILNMFPEAGPMFKKI